LEGGSVHKAAKRGLRSNKQLFRSIFENSQIGISVFEIDSREIVSNRALQEMLGYTGEELTRLERWDEMVPPENASLALSDMLSSSRVSGRRTNMNNVSSAGTAGSSLPTEGSSC
jgi:PAS domain S-box-containing protein